MPVLGFVPGAVAVQLARVITSAWCRWWKLPAGLPCWSSTVAAKPLGCRFPSGIAGGPGSW